MNYSDNAMPRYQSRAELEDALRHPRVRAFLDAIASAEGTRGRGDDGYNVNVGGRLFHSYARHPHNRVQLNPRLRSDAAGRYQFLSSTWDPLARRLGLNDFSPRNQDIGAAALIAERGAMQHIINGNIPAAMHCVRQVWASLPNAGYGQREVSRSSFLQNFTNALRAIGNGIVDGVQAVGNFIGNGVRTVGSAIGSMFSRDNQQVPEQPRPPAANAGWVVSPSGTVQAAPASPEAAYAPFGPPQRPNFTPTQGHPPANGWVNNRPPGPSVPSNVVMGDSIGVSMQSQYPGARNVAVGGVSIGAASAQFRHLPRGSVADVYLGTNNGGYSPEENRRQTMRFLQAAENHGVRINNWILPGNHRGSMRADHGLRNAADVISQTIQEYNASRPNQPPIQTVATRDRGVALAPDGYHLSPTGNRQVRTMVAQAQPPAPQPTYASAPPREPHNGGWVVRSPNRTA